MPVGLEIRDEQGRVTLFATGGVTKIIGSFLTGTSPGSTTVALPAGEVFFVSVPVGTYTGAPPVVTYHGGGHFQWVFGGYAAPVNHRIYYGVIHG